MKQRPLGRTGLLVSEIGFGTWGLGGNTGGAVAYGSTDDGESLRALRAALDCGVNFYDTSDLYGFGHSEQLLGEAFAGHRDRVVLSTKAGFLDASGAQDFSPDRLRLALENSLKRLRTDRVEVFLLHNPPADLLQTRPEVAALLQALQREGKTRAWGVSARSPEDGLNAVQDGAQVLQVNFNMADQRALQNGLLELCGQRQTGVVIRTPLCFGFLTGQYADQAAFAPDDHRARWSPEQRQRWSEAGRELASAVGGPGQTAAQIALRFCLSYPVVSTVIPGMLTPGHVAENSAASDLGPLAPEAVRRVEESYRHQTIFDAANRPGLPGAPPRR